MAEAEPHWPLLPAGGVGLPTEAGKGLQQTGWVSVDGARSGGAETVQKAEDIEDVDSREQSRQRQREHAIL